MADMELRILNSSFADIGVIDIFDSLIWKDKFVGYGDFEVTASPETGIITNTNAGRYLRLQDSEHLMIIEDLNIDWDVTDGAKVVVKGVSLESILGWRIVWNKTTLTGNFQNGIQQLLNENAINPTVEARKLTRLEFEASTDPLITSLTIDRPFLGETLYTAITELCISRGIGYKITLTPEGKLRFKLYAGVDRSYGQTTNPYVVFSPDFDNLLNSNYHASDSALKTVTLVVGQGEGDELITKVVEIPGGGGSDMDRRELFTDGKNVEKTLPEGTLTDAEYLAQVGTRAAAYIAQLEQIGLEALSEHVVVQTFEGEEDGSDQLYIYGRDFFMGDIIQTADDYGHEGKSQITELIHSEDINGPKVYPTFTTVA